MTVVLRPVTTEPSMSFYVGTRDKSLIRECANHADAVTIRGTAGPKVIRQMRHEDFASPVLFDREDWKVDPDERTDTAEWVDEQLAAHADRVLTPGRTVLWTPKDPAEGLAAAELELADARAHDATALLNIDARHLTRNTDALIRVLNEGGGDVAIILADPSDPLKPAGGVAALRRLAAAVHELTILRADHGGLGAVAFGANHAGLGLSATNRHGSIQGRAPFAKRGDCSARVFSVFFADWFTAMVIAGWSLADPRFMNCYLPGCDGAPLSRFLDEDQAHHAVAHNIHALGHVADLVLNAPDDTTRRSTFLDYCREAVARYDLVGFHGPQDPKPQLTGWVLS